MANSLGIDLTDAVVILKQSYFAPGYKNTDHPFRASSGFGCLPFTMGQALGGEFISDGEQVRVSGHDVERLATPEEIARFDN